ncbi:hypothetical protein [Sulfuracidifex metallicus]|uniref:hypothetical protein n=1 Tax=Sulfuracidifex metallicus TaxID=47303 RepID=UPI0006CF46F8|nr:hypothetical protein [Sulfuracidifex metallicus]
MICLNFILLFILGSFLIITLFITFRTLRKPSFTDTLVFLSLYIAFYSSIIIYYVGGSLILSILVLISIAIVVVVFRS